MSGITGWVENRNRADTVSCTLHRMMATIRHRGPHGTASYIDELAAVGYCHLATDGVENRFSPLVLQPLVKGHICAALDGVFEKDIFSRCTDTEYVIALYEKYGDSFCEHLSGAFALVLWDKVRKRLFLARDGLGRKPLFYRVEPNRLIFGSEIKSILAAPEVPKTIHYGALAKYMMFSYIPQPETAFEGIHRLPPGHVVVWQVGGNDNTPNFSTHKFWKFDWNCEETTDSYDSCRLRLEELVHQSVQNTVTGVPNLVSFLSGGIDSTITTGVLANTPPFGSELSTKRLMTLNVGFEAADYDETPFAVAAAEKFGTEHRTLMVKPHLSELLPKLVYHFDEPYSDSSAIPTWYLCEFASKFAPVAITGDGGDELFAGYQRYQAMRWSTAIEWIPRPLRTAISAMLDRVFSTLIFPKTSQKSLFYKLRRFLEAIGMPQAERYLQWIAIFNRQRLIAVWKDDFLRHSAESESYSSVAASAEQGLEMLSSAFEAGNTRDIVTASCIVDFLTNFPGDLSPKVDVIGAAHGLECRAPLLAEPILDFAMKLPVRHKIRGRTGKFIFRDAFRQLLPRPILHRGKMGFGAPLGNWFRTTEREYVLDTLSPETIRKRPFLDSRQVERMITEHFSGTFDHSYRIWSLLVLENWLQSQ